MIANASLLWLAALVGLIVMVVDKCFTFCIPATILFFCLYHIY